MVKEQLYHKTVDILVQAYFKGTLQFTNCMACAIGNIVAASNGIGISNDKYCRWSAVANWTLYWDVVKQESDNEAGVIMVSKTGYSPKELNRMEIAFESEKWTQGDAMFNGLMAVVNVLDKIHENKDEVVTQSSKQKFKRQIPNPLFT